MADYVTRKALAENLMFYMKLNRLSRGDISKKTGAAYTTVADWLRGRTFPRDDKLDRLAEIFHITVSDLLRHKDNIMIPPSSIEQNFKSLPELGEIACGEPITAEQNYTHSTIVPGDVRADFCLVCHGDSMIEKGLHDGDRVYIRRQDHVNDGEIAAVLINNECTLKVFYYYPDTNMVILRPANSNYKDLVYQDEQINQIRVIGKAVGASIKL